MSAWIDPPPDNLDHALIAWFALGVLVLALVKVFWVELRAGVRSMLTRSRRLFAPDPVLSRHMSIYIRPVDAAARLRVTEKAIRKYARKGRIRWQKGVSGSGRAVLMVHAGDVADLEATQNGSIKY